LIPSQGGNIRALDLPNLYHLYNSNLNFSPDGKHLLFRCSSRPHDIRHNRGDITVSILMVNYQNLSLRKILSKGGVYDEQDTMTYPAFSPDGNLIVYVEEYEIGSSEGEFVIIDLTGKKISRISPTHLKMGDYYRSPSFSPDGQEILCTMYSSKKTANGVGKYIIYLVNWRTGVKRKLALGYHPTFVDGGKAIVFERSSNSLFNSPNDLYRLDLTSGARPRLILRNAKSPSGQVEQG
jgi:Tol biopolymer transport system component